MVIYRIDYYYELPDEPQDSTTICFSTLERAVQKYNKLILQIKDNFSEEFGDTGTNTEVDESGDFCTYTIYNGDYNHFERVSLLEEELDSERVKMVSKSKVAELQKEQNRITSWPTSEG